MTDNPPHINAPGIPVQTAPSRDLGNTPNTPGTDSNLTKPPGYKAFERGSVVPGTTKEGIGPSSEVNVSFDTQLELYNALDEVDSFLEKATYGQDQTRFSEVMSAQMSHLRTSAQGYELFKNELAERRKIEQIPDKTKREQALKKHEESLKKRKEKIKKIQEEKKKGGGDHVEGYTPTDKDKKSQAEIKKLLDELRKEFNVNPAIGDVDLEKKLSQYLEGTEHKNIFSSLQEMVQAVAYLEDVEKTVAFQAGWDITDQGTRTISADFTITPVIVRQLTQAGVDSREVQMLQDIAKRAHVGDWKGVAALVTTVSAAAWNVWGNLQIGSVHLGGVADIVHRLDLSGLPAVVGAIQQDPIPATVALVLTGIGAVGARSLLRRVDHWQMEFPEGQTEASLTYQVRFRHVPPPAGTDGNPLRSMYKGDATGATRFLNAIENSRAGLARALHVHEGELEGWLNVSNSLLAAETKGMQLPHRIAISQNINRILEQEYKRTTGGSHKTLEDLVGEDRIEDVMKIVERAYDEVALNAGAKEIDTVTKAVAIRIMLGEKLKPETLTVLQTRLAEFKKGREVDVTQKEKELNEQRSEREGHLNRQNVAKARITELQGQITQAEKDRETRDIELKKAQRIQGSPSEKDTSGTVTKPAKGKIGTYEERKNNIEKAVKDAEGELGERKVAGTGLYSKRIGIDRQLASANPAASAAQKELEFRTQRLSFLKSTESAEEWRLHKDPTQLEFDDLSGTGPKSVDAAQKIAEETGEKKAELEAEKNSLNQDIARQERIIHEARDAGGKLDQINTQIDTAIEAVADAQANYDVEDNKLTRSTTERNKLLQDEFAIDATKGVPTDAMLNSVSANLQAEMTKLQAELDEIANKKVDGKYYEKSPEDAKNEKVMTILIEVMGPNNDKLNKFMTALLERGIKLEDLANIHNDEGYHLLLKQFFGDDVLTQGPNGKYEIATTILSKSRLCQTGFEMWNIDGGRATSTEFFAGDAEGLRWFQEARMFSESNQNLQAQITGLRSIPNRSADDQARLEQMEKQYRANEGSRNKILGQLYDTRIAPLLTQDRVRTGELIRRTFYKFTQDAVLGFAEVIPVSSSRRQDVVTTPQGQMVVEGVEFSETTRAIIERGALKAVNIDGFPGLSVSAKVSGTGSPGAVEGAVIVNRDAGGIQSVSPENNTSIPQVVRQIFHGEPEARRESVDTRAFTRPLYIQLPATRQEAIDSGIVDPEFIIWVYGTNNADTDPKRGLDELQSSPIDLTQLPDARGDLRGVPLEVGRFFYYSDDQQRKAFDLTLVTDAVMLGVAPPTSIDARRAGFSPEFIALMYKPVTSGALRDHGQLQAELNGNPALGLNKLPATRKDALDQDIHPKIVDALYTQDDPGGPLTEKEIQTALGNMTKADLQKLPKTIAEALALGIPQSVVDVLYAKEDKGKKKDENAVRMKASALQVNVKKLPLNENEAMSAGYPKELRAILYNLSTGLPKTEAEIRQGFLTINQSDIDQIYLQTREDAEAKKLPQGIVELLFEKKSPERRRIDSEVKQLSQNAHFDVSTFPTDRDALLTQFPNFPQILTNSLYNVVRPGTPKSEQDARTALRAMDPAALASIATQWANRQNIPPALPNELSELFFQPDSPGSKRTAQEVHTAAGISPWNVTMLDELGNRFQNSNALTGEALKFFYNRVTDVQRTNQNIDLFIESFPSLRSTLTPAERAHWGPTLDYVYDASGNRHSAQDLRQVQINVNGNLQNVVDTLFTISGDDLIRATYQREIASAVSSLDPVSQMQLLGDRFPSGRVFGGEFVLQQTNGQLEIYFSRAGLEQSFPLHEFLNETTTFSPLVGNAISTQGTSFRDDIAKAAANGIVEAIQARPV